MQPEPRNEASPIERLQDSPEINSDITKNHQDEFRNYFSFLNAKALQRVRKGEGSHIDRGDRRSYISRFFREK